METAGQKKRGVGEQRKKNFLNGSRKHIHAYARQFARKKKYIDKVQTQVLSTFSRASPFAASALSSFYCHLCFNLIPSLFLSFSLLRFYNVLHHEKKGKCEDEAFCV